MRLPRRKFLHLAAGSGCLAFLPRTAAALDYPTRPVHVVVGFATGINPDIIARLMAQALSAQLGQQFIVDDRPGAASNIATEIVVRSPPDGYTLLAVVSTNAINTTLYRHLSFDFSRDIAPVGGTVRLPSVLVVAPSFSAATFPEFLAYAKANPGKLAMASNGKGTASHVIGELLQAMAGIELLHVPYRTSYVPDLLSGQVQVAFSPLAQSIGLIKGGKLKALAVTGASRSGALPDIPVVAEFLPSYEAYVWNGIGAPRSTPMEIVDKLNAAINACLAAPAMTARLADLGAEAMPMTPGQFGQFISSETEKWAKVIRAAHITPD